MKDKLKQLLESLKEKMKSVTDMKLLEAVKTQFLGKSGELTAMLRDMKSVPKEERPLVGKLVNETREEMESCIGEKETLLLAEEQSARLAEETVDVTLPAVKRERGALHPLSIVKKQILDTFTGMGFSIAEGPEIETDYYSFEALNVPKDHPARDMQDTFYLADNILLRPHTSPVQIRTMEQVQGPLRILCPGRVYRADDDATHSPVFHQIEGLVIDKNVSLCDLKGLLDEFARTVFSNETKTRFRPSYFPFTEPSVEVDVTCTMCHGKGCRICKGTGWIEILGAGVVNRKVLEYGKIPAEYSGLAFGVGIERIAMIKYGIPDMRLLFENDVRLLSQFK